ncbi:hypothetical protein GCM10022221_54710 [Actinocorallia aurea]
MAQKATTLKALAYILNDADELLVIRHVDHSYERVGLEVPGGTVRPGEPPQAAALREAHEETSLQGLVLISPLGQTNYDITPLREEVQHRHFFYLRAPGPRPPRWPSAELHDGLAEPTRFECFWIPLQNAHVLSAGHGALVPELWHALTSGDETTKT